MKIRIRLLMLFLLIFCFFNSFGQKLIYTGDFHFLGYDNDDPVFRLYDKEADLNSLYKFKKGSNYDNCGFYEYKRLEIPASELELVYNDILVRRFKKREEFQNEVYCTIDTLKLKNWSINYSLFSSEYKKLFIFLENEYKYLTLEIDFNQSPPEIRYIPIKADRGYIINDWLYFSFFHEQYEYSPWPHDIFRVKINDWQNTELIMEGSEYDEWFLYPESHVIGTDIDLSELLTKEQSRKSEILYNVQNKSYAIVPNMSQNILRFDSKYYNYFPTRDHKRGIETINLEPLPELPTVYPYTEHEVLPREVWYNVPLKKKSFDGTFISSYLLREAPKSELEKLDNSQLRLLRNALYAQYGYVFKSKDLQEFYNQFEWYRMMTAKRENNEAIKLLPEDKSRAEMIRDIELK